MFKFSLIAIAIGVSVLFGCNYFTDETETKAEISPVVAAPANWEALLQDRGNWELIATLNRDVRQQYWHLFYMEPDNKSSILKAFIDGKEFLFVIEKTIGLPSTEPIQFYFAQPEGMTGRVNDANGKPLSARVDLFYPSPPYWYTHWGPETNIRREESGFAATFDAGFGGWQFEETGEDFEEWVLGSVEFRATREGASFATNYAPHIKEGYVLKIFVR